MDQYVQSKVESTCKLKLHIPLENLIHTIFTKLNLDIEVAGTIYCDNLDNPIHVDINKGNSDSVYTPNNVINFHTHPISAYNKGKTVWGWPSGEDIRETIKFAMAGNKAHLVFTVEGLYTIQVNPCKIKKMKEMLTPEERGLFIFMIEEYFKTTHNFRGVQEVNNLAKNNILITPYSFIDFANSFSLHNLLCATRKVHKKTECMDIHKVGHTGIHSEENNNILKYSGLQNEIFNRIPSNGFPETEKNYIITQSSKDYLDDNDYTELRSINEFGLERPFPEHKIKQYIAKFKQIATMFDGDKCTTEWNSKNANNWFFINFFPTQYYVQKGYLDGNRYVTPDKSLMDLVHLNHEPFIRIFSNQKEGCSIKSIGEKNNFKTLFSSTTVHRFAKNSFGKTSTFFSSISMAQLCALFKKVTQLISKRKKVNLQNLKKGLTINTSVLKQFLDYLT